MQNRQPSWGKWSLIPSVKIWQAVALSLNIDPGKVRTERDWEDELIFDESQTFRDRVQVTGANIGNSDLLPVRAVGRAQNTETVLANFAAWAISIGWEIPRELADLAIQAKNATENHLHPSERTPNQAASEPGPKSRNAYLRTIDALTRALISGRTGRPHQDSQAVIAALDRAGIQCPVNERTLADYLKEADRLAD